MKKMDVLKYCMAGGIMLLGAITFSATAQQEKKVHVIVEECDHGDSVIHKEVKVIRMDDLENLDSLQHVFEMKHEDFEKQMKVFAIKMDSMDFDFNFTTEMEKLDEEIIAMLKEKGIVLDGLSDGKDKHHMVFVTKDGADEKVDVQTIVTEKGEKVKVVRSKSNHPIEWHTASSHAKQTITAIPVDDLNVLKKFGVDSKILLAEPLDVKNVEVKIKKEIKNGKETTVLSFECAVDPNAKHALNVYSKEGKVVASSSAKTEKAAVDVAVEKDKEPYYLLLTQNNRLFGRKIVL